MKMPLTTNRPLAVFSTALVLAAAACQAAESPPTADSTTTSVDAPSNGAQPTVPGLLAASTRGGTQGLIAMLSATAEIASVETIDAPSDLLADVLVAGDQVHFTTCCEPPSGLRWRTVEGADTLLPMGFGQAVDGDSRRVLVVDPNGGYLRTDFIDEPPVTVRSVSGEWMPRDGALSGSGHTAVVAVDNDGRGGVFWVPPGSEFFDSDPPIVTGEELGGVPGIPAVDADGNVWLLVLRPDVAATVRRVRVDPGTGEITEVHSSGEVVDQGFDSSGRYLLTVYADGEVTWRRITDDRETKLELPPLDRADW